MNSLKPLDLIFKLEEEIEKNNLKNLELKSDFNSGKINLSQYTTKIEEIENRNKEISNQITSIEKDLSEQQKILKKEIESVIDNFQVELNPDNITDIKVDFYSSIGFYYPVGLKCQDYPNRIEISFPQELIDLLGPPNSIALIKNFPQQPPAHLVEILRTIEEEILGKSRLDEEVQSLYQEFDVAQPTKLSTKLRINIYSLDAEQFGLEVDLKEFPQLPKIIPSQKMEKFIFLDSLRSIRSWNPSSSHVVHILREISAILDRKLRINLELKLLKQKNLDAIFDSVNNMIHISLTESKTNPKKYKFDIQIPNNYPSSPPTINLVTLPQDQQLAEKFQTAINDFIIEWFPASNLAEFFNKLRESMAETSQFVCSICKNLTCPYCQKNVAGTIPGVQGEFECQITCSHCKRIFHKCCWKEYVKYSQKCPICQGHISIW
jgi:ubiquitin-protein ligase